MSGTKHRIIFGPQNLPKMRILLFVHFFVVSTICWNKTLMNFDERSSLTHSLIKGRRIIVFYLVPPGILLAVSSRNVL